MPFGDFGRRLSLLMSGPKLGRTQAWISTNKHHSGTHGPNNIGCECAAQLLQDAYMKGQYICCLDYQEAYDRMDPQITFRFLSSLVGRRVFFWFCCLFGAASDGCCFVGSLVSRRWKMLRGKQACSSMVFWRQFSPRTSVGHTSSGCCCQFYRPYSCLLEWPGR